MAVRETRPRGEEQDESVPSAEALAKSRLVVYYLSVGKDCTTCENIEAYTREALDTYFSAQLASGEILFAKADMDLPQHKHFATDFGLYTKSIVLARIEHGERTRWENLTGIWDRVYDKPAFIAFIRDNINRFLDETP